MEPGSKGAGHGSRDGARLLPLPEQFDALNLGGMALYKIGIVLFNIVPCIVLYLVR
jgi:hypothetical protein